MNSAAMKRGNDGIFSPGSPETQRLKMDIDQGIPPAAILNLNITDKDIDVDKLKIECKDLPDWSYDFAAYLAKSISRSTNDDGKESMDNLVTCLRNLMLKFTTGLREDMKGMETRMGKLEEENKSLKQKLSDQEAYSRRSNLIINGIPEYQTQNLFSVFRNLLKSELSIDKDIMIERIHRMGPRPQSHQQRPRPIIVRFTNYQDRQLVWSNRNRRSRRPFNQAPTLFSRFHIIEDYPPAVVEARKRLNPIAYEAWNTHGMSATVKMDKLIVNGTTYDIDTLDKLPRCLIPISKSYRETSNQISFFRKYCPLSNHSPAPFVINDKHYNCSEQMFLSEKCFAYGHIEEGNNIMKMDDPGRMVQEAKVCQGYRKVWDENKFDIMLTAQLGKYTQNEEHHDFLLSTGEKTIVEGSPYDQTWGVGIAFNDPIIDDSRNWEGENLLGEALMIARRLIRPCQARLPETSHVQSSQGFTQTHKSGPVVQSSQGFSQSHSTPMESTHSSDTTSIPPKQDHTIRPTSPSHTQGFDAHHDPNNENLRPHSPNMDRY